MKTAIVYYSMGGNTAYAASRISEAIGENAVLIEIAPVKAYPSKGFRKFFWGGKSAVMSDKPKLRPYSFEAEKYDRIVIGFPVWASRIAPPIRSFVVENKESLKGKTISAFACEGGSGAEKALKALMELIGITGYEATAILIDPKDRPSEDTEKALSDFCAKLSE